MTLVFFLFIPTPANAEIDFGDTIALDAGHNIPGLEPLSEKEQKPFKVRQYDIPIEVIGGWKNVAQSEFLDKETRDLVVHKKGDKTYIRFFVGETEGIDFNGFDEKFKEYRLKETLVGRRIQGHMSVRVSDPTNPAFPPLTVKMQRDDGYNWRGNATDAVRINDAVERTLLQTPHDRSFLRLYPERFGAGVEWGDSAYGYSIRLHKEAPKGTPGTDVSVHGLLGNRKLLEQVADTWKKGATPEQWYEQEYLPKLGKFNAQLNFRMGLYLQLHTQNLLVRIDPKTGVIVGFVGRDMPDMMLAPGNRILSGQSAAPLLDAEGTIHDAHLNNSFQRPGLERAGAHADQYARQAVIALYREMEGPEGQRAKERAGKAYLQAYQTEAESIVGAKVPVSRDHTVLVERGEIGYTTQRIHDGLAEQAAPKFFEHDLPPNQDQLKRLFERKSKKGEVYAFSPEGLIRADTLRMEGKAIYATDGHNIFIVDPATHQSLAVVTGFPNPLERQQLVVVSPANAVAGCLKKK